MSAIEFEMAEIPELEPEIPEAEIGDGLGTSIKKYLHTGEFSDLTIRTTDQEFTVHRLIVCGQSEYFARLYKKEWAEAVENAINLRDDDPRAIEAMVNHMYGYDYNSSGSDKGRQPPMLFNIKVYQVADKYAIPQLKKIAKEKFEEVARTCWKMDDFPVAIEEAYNCTLKTDRGLRDPLVNICRKEIAGLRKNDNFLDVLENTIGFAADLALSLAQKHIQLSNTKSYSCSSCNAQWILYTGKQQQRCPSCGLSKYN